MLVVTSIFVAEIEGRHGVAELLDQELLLAKEKNPLEGVRELISMYEGKNRVQPME